MIDLVLQAWGCLPWDIATQEAAAKSADFQQQIKHTFVSR